MSGLRRVRHWHCSSSIFRSGKAAGLQGPKGSESRYLYSAGTTVTAGGLVGIHMLVNSITSRLKAQSLHLFLQSMIWSSLG